MEGFCKEERVMRAGQEEAGRWGGSRFAQMSSPVQMIIFKSFGGWPSSGADGGRFQAPRVDGKTRKKGQRLGRL